MNELVYAVFYLNNNDEITIEGKSVFHVFLELNRRFPEGLSCIDIGFSGKDEEDSKKNLQEFLNLYNKGK